MEEWDAPNYYSENQCHRYFVAEQELDVQEINKKKYQWYIFLNYIYSIVIKHILQTSLSERKKKTKTKIKKIFYLYRMTYDHNDKNKQNLRVSSANVCSPRWLKLGSSFNGCRHRWHAKFTFVFMSIIVWTMTAILFLCSYRWRRCLAFVDHDEANRHGFVSPYNEAFVNCNAHLWHFIITLLEVFFFFFLIQNNNMNTILSRIHTNTHLKDRLAFIITLFWL